jgi:stearoyl-CoA desaturase (delta-9 desaturase)
VISTRVRDWTNRIAIMALVLIPLAGTALAVGLLWQRAVSWEDLLLMAGLYVPISLGVTVGFHRYLTHRGFRTSPVMKALLLILGSMALDGSAIAFAATHRQHHALADQEGDPHSPVDGFWHAHVGWLFRGQVADARIFARDLQDDQLVMLVSRLFPVWAVLSVAVPFLIGGWEGLLWGGLVRIFLIHHVTWSVNSVCHTIGRRPFATRDRSRNEWVVGLLALGEGWHNNHHAFPRSALHGLHWWQFDLSGLTIRGLARLGLVWDVQRVSGTEIRARSTRSTRKAVVPRSGPARRAATRTAGGAGQGGPVGVSYPETRDVEPIRSV